MSPVYTKKRLSNLPLTCPGPILGQVSGQKSLLSD